MKMDVEMLEELHVGSLQYGSVPTAPLHLKGIVILELLLRAQPWRSWRGSGHKQIKESVE